MCDQIREISKYAKGQIWYYRDSENKYSRHTTQGLLCGSRPVLIIGYIYEPGYSMKATVLPITHGKSAEENNALDRFFLYSLLGLDGMSYVACNQPMTVPTSRFEKYVGSVSYSKLQEIVAKMNSYLLADEAPKTAEWLMAAESKKQISANQNSTDKDAPKAEDTKKPAPTESKSTPKKAPKTAPKKSNKPEVAEESLIKGPFKESIEKGEYVAKKGLVDTGTLVDTITKEDFSDNFQEVLEYNSKLKRAPVVSLVRNTEDNKIFINSQAAGVYYHLSPSAINRSARLIVSTSAGLFERVKLG